MPIVKRLVSAGLIPLAGVVALGCGSSVATTKPKTTSPPTTAATTTTLSGPTATTQTTVVPTTTPTFLSGSMCENGQINATSTVTGAGLGNRDLVIVFVNSSNSTCLLMGWPGVAGLNAQGAQIAQAVRQLSAFNGGGVPAGKTSLPTVTLGPGQMASTTVDGDDGPVGTATSCPNFASFLVTPPNFTQSQTVSSAGDQGGGTDFPYCSSIFVTPVVPGSTGALG